MPQNETGLRGKNIDIRIRADTSYEIKRYREAVMAVKGGELMKDSGIRKNKGDGFRLQRALSQAGYSKDDINYIAKLVCKHIGNENFKQQIYKDLRIDLGEYAYQEAYNSIKPVLKKYSK